MEGGFGQPHGSVNDMWNKMVLEIRKVDRDMLGWLRCFGHTVKESWWCNESVQSKVRVKKDCFREWFRCKNDTTWEKYNKTKKDQEGGEWRKNSRF